ncbi:hypothetical protein PFISCL1PPCAC_1363, partial [Pristionchus fissidentatus]
RVRISIILVRKCTFGAAVDCAWKHTTNRFIFRAFSPVATLFARNESNVYREIHGIRRVQSAESQHKYVQLTSCPLIGHSSISLI